MSVSVGKMKILTPLQIQKFGKGIAMRKTTSSLCISLLFQLIKLTVYH